MRRDNPSTSCRRKPASIADLAPLPPLSDKRVRRRAVASRLAVQSGRECRSQELEVVERYLDS